MFWKFFLAFWLALLVAGIGVGTTVWLRHNAESTDHSANRADAGPEPELPWQPDHDHPGGLPPPEFAGRHLPDLDRHGDFSPPGLLPDRHDHFRGPHPPPPRGSTLLPILIGLFASFLFSAALAWYFARPIRSLRQAFRAVAQGDLDTRIGPSMGKRRDELSDLGRDFDHMVGQIHSLLNAQQRLLHDVSHELRSPLARIQAAIGLAQQQPEKVPDTLERIERETQRISDLVGELLELSRLEAGVATGENTELDLGGLLDDIVADARFEAKQLELEIRYSGAPDLQVQGCGELLHRAFENVLRNALQHCKKPGVIDVIVHFNPDTRLFQLSIADQGTGVAESDLTAIFQPFFRSGKTSKADSTGLGLAIARHAIIAHGGHIQAVNRPEGGLQVNLDIPFP
jgi:two-component system OmpR family sensor kinase